MDEKMVSLRINDIPVTVPEGSTVLEAARSAGFNIPSLCFLKDINEIGACRICVVEVKGAKSLVASCVYPVAEGMEVYTNTERVRKSRQLTLELILSNHRMDCLTCSRNSHCELLQLAGDLGIDAVRYANDNMPPQIEASAPHLVRDNSKCVLCRRCTAVCRKTQEVGVIGPNDRGFHTHIGCAFDRDLAEVDCVSCGQCIVACPTGALSEKDDTARVLAAALLPGTLGVDKAWPSKFLIALLAARPDVTPVLGSAPVDDARKYKDADEISAMRRASQINDQVVEAAIAAVRAGAVESELAAYVEGLYRQHGADRSGEGQLVCFGPNGADPHHAPNGTVLRDGDSVVLDIFIPIRRYWCDMTRTVFFRSVSDEGRRVYETVKAANLAAEAVIRPGVPMKDIDRAARKLIEDAGYGPFFTHRLGHGCGLDCHEPPDNSASSPAVAEPGMVFSVEPGIYLPGKLGVRIEDLVLVTEDGCEVLNHASKELRVVD